MTSIIKKEQNNKSKIKYRKISLKNGNSLIYKNGNWYRNGKQLTKLYNYSFYDTKDKTHKRLTQDGNTLPLVKNNNFITVGDKKQAYQILEQEKINKINTYKNQLINKIGRHLFGDKFITSGITKIQKKYNDEFDDIDKKLYSQENGSKHYASDELAAVLELQNKYPNLGKLARWEFDRNAESKLRGEPYNFKNDFYVYKDAEDKIIVPKNAKILAGEAINRQDIKEIKAAAKRNNIDYWDLLSIAAGETAIGNVQGWSNGTESSKMNSRVAGRRSKDAGGYSELVHDHIYQSGSDIPATSELLYASGIPTREARPFNAITDSKNIIRDITESRANRLIQQSNEYLSNRGTALDHISRMWKENPNSLNPYNAQVDNGRDYKTKVYDNVKLLKQIEELNPDLYKYGGLIRRRLSNAGYLSE